MLNDLGVDPYEWFDNPLDKMPIATNDRFDMYGSSDADYAFMKAQVERRDPPAEFMEVPTSVTNPKPEKKTKIEKIQRLFLRTQNLLQSLMNMHLRGQSRDFFDCL